METEFKLDYEDNEKLLEKFKQVGDQAEKITNDYLAETGVKIARDKLIELTPVSNVNKPHAKTSDPYKAQMENLGFKLITKGGDANSPGSFGYLIFPDEGRGPRNHVAQNFSGRALEASRDPIVEGLLDRLNQFLEEG